MTNERIYGSVELLAGWINLNSDPYVRMKLKRLFPAAKDKGDGYLRLKATPSNAEDVAWILSRWPHEMRPGVSQWLRATVNANKANRTASQQILDGTRELQINTALPLRHYQSQAVALTTTSPGLLIGDDVGLGKTATGIGVILAHPLPALVVCPVHLQRQWVDQIRKFAPALRCHVVKQRGEYHLPPHDVTIISYSKIADWANKVQWHTVIFDEVHELRGEKTAKGDAASFLAQACQVRVGLSATPVFNYAGQIYNVMSAIAPGALGTRDEFMREWHCDFKGRVANPVALGEWLRSQFIYIRRTRAEVGRELPPEEKITHIVEHDPKIMDTMKALGRHLATKVLEGTFTEKGIAARELDARLRLVTGLAKAPFVADFVQSLVENGEPVILAGWHRDVYDVWKAKFEAAGIRFALYTGSEDGNAKAFAAAKFMAREIDVLILSLRSGEGLDGLQTVGRTVVFGELDWSPQRHHQLVGRLRRDGMDMASRVTAFYLVAETGSDPIVSQVLGAKWLSATAVTDPDKLNPNADFTQQEEESRVALLAKDWLQRCQ